VLAECVCVMFQATLIDDIDDFKQRLALFPLPKPFTAHDK